MFNYNQPQFATNPYMRNNYAPQNYAPMQYQVPQQTQPVSMNQQSIQYDMPVQYVGNANLKEVEGYILFPNQKAFFIDKPSGMCYEKICGNDGQSYITAYKRVENENTSNSSTESSINVADFVKKDTLSDYITIEQYNEVLGKIEQLQKQLAGVKPNGAKQ